MPPPQPLPPPPLPLQPRLGPRLPLLFKIVTLGWIVLPVCGIFIVFYSALRRQNPWEDSGIGGLMKIIFEFAAFWVGLGGWSHSVLGVASNWYDVMHGTGSPLFSLASLLLLCLPLPIGLLLRKRKPWAFVCAYICLGLSPILFIWTAFSHGYYISIGLFLIILGIYFVFAVLLSLYFVKVQRSFRAQ